MASIPHIKYIESLVLSKFSIDEIKEKLEEYNLEFNKKVVSIIIKTLRDEKPDYFDGQDPEPADPEWIRDVGVVEMYSHFTNHVVDEDSAPVDGAFKLINDPMMYRLITSMAIALMDDQDIELIVNGKFNMEYTSEDIKMFLKYFFNLDGWALKERQDYVEKVKDPQLSQYYKIALKKDKGYLMWKLGAAPELDYGKMMKDMVTDSYYNFKEQGDVKPELAQKWARVAIKLTDKIEKYNKEKKGDGAESFMDNFEFEIKSVASEKEEAGKEDIEDEIPHISDMQEDHPALDGGDEDDS